MKRHVIKNFEELMEVFPSLTMAQIINVYMGLQERIARISFLMEVGSERYSPDILENNWIDCMKSDAFLSTYLARAYCIQNGFMR